MNAKIITAPNNYELDNKINEVVRTKEIGLITGIETNDCITGNKIGIVIFS